MSDTQGRRKYFIRSAGSWCYDRSGLSFPKRVSFDIEGAIRAVFSDAEIRWERYLGWRNQPEVVVFEIDDQVLTSDLNRLIKSFDAPIEAAGLYNRLHHHEYWGYDNDGAGEWGSVYDDNENEEAEEYAPV